MTPAARLDMAIDLVADILDRRLAADRAVRSWFRARRYAGSGDRRAVTALVYDVLRRRGELAWRLGGAASPRLLTLAASGIEFEELDTLCSGLPRAPAPLDEAERDALQGRAQPAEPMPPWAEHNYPAWLHDDFVARFGADLALEMAALSGRAEVDFRVNTLKQTRDWAQRQWADEGVRTAPTPFAPTGLRLAESARLEQHRFLTEGIVEPQDEAAQLASLLVDAQPGMTVIDLCAGGGGKALALAAAMGNRGRVLAFDANPWRIRPLAERAARAGAGIIKQPRSRDGLAGTADRVLLDVPCSGSGAWRRNPEARWHLNEADLADHEKVQAALLDEGAALVKPGGRLVYATCSLLACEDEGAVDAFLARNPGFRRLDMAEIWRDVMGGTAPFAGPDMFLTPHRHGTDGFFTSALLRLG
jgi:16S rRNA (cytosine967-C5)-methyltransferase